MIKKRINMNCLLFTLTAKKSLILAISCFLFFALFLSMPQAQIEWPHTTLSKDGVPISYEVCGSGEQTLIFVHGWSCDARYWRAQVKPFSQKYRVITLDLAGHGHSGLARKQYTMTSFGADIQAVTEATNSHSVILIGHSMGGTVIAEAARLMPNKVIGLIGVDTLDNIEYPLTPEELKAMIAPLEQDFRTGSREFANAMILPSTDSQLREWILADISSAPPDVAISAVKEMMSQYITGDAAKIFDTIRIPVVTVNGDLWPIAYEANQRHMFSFSAIIIKNADHFLMMNRVEEFNQALEKAIQKILETKTSH